MTGSLFECTIYRAQKVKRCCRNTCKSPFSCHWRWKGALKYQKWLSYFSGLFTALGPLKARACLAKALKPPSTQQPASFNSRLNAFNLVCVVLGEICNRPETAALCFCSFFDVCWIWPWSLHFSQLSALLLLLQLLHKQASYNCIRNGFTQQTSGLAECPNLAL